MRPFKPVDDDNHEVSLVSIAVDIGVLLVSIYIYINLTALHELLRAAVLMVGISFILSMALDFYRELDN